MPLYSYEVMNQEGEKIEDSFMAHSQNEVLAMIRENGYCPIRVKEIKNKNKSKEIVFWRVKKKDLAIFCRQFYTMINAGSTILNSLDIQRKRTNNKKLQQILNFIYDEVQKGHSLSESMGKHLEVFPDMLVHMIESGELSGNLDTVLERMAIQYEKETKIIGKMKTAMVYPVFLMIACIAIIIFLLTFVMPTFITMFDISGSELPKPTQIIISMSNIIQNNWVVLFLVVGSFMMIIQIFKKTDIGKRFFDMLKISIPIVKNTVQNIIVLRFARNMATLLASGVNMVQAMEIVTKIVGNKIVEGQLISSKQKIVKGIPLSEALKDIRVFPEMLIAMVEIGEESGTLDDILDKTANFYDNEVEQSLNKMTSLMEPVMILIMALLVGGIVIAMLLPMLEMFSTVKSL